jgi:hypothetical protein
MYARKYQKSQKISELGDTFQQGWEWPRTLTCHPSTYRYVQTKSKKQMLTNNE